MVVLADLCLIRWAAFLNSLAFFMLIHPSFSQDSRWEVNPSIMYFESVCILTGWYGGMTSSAATTAAISPIWLDWASPGIRSAWFLGSSCANQTPLLHCAFFLPLFMQALSVYTIISWLCGIGPQCLYLCAMWVEFLSGFMNIRKHSARLSLQVIEGSKVISLFDYLALSFLCFRDLIRDIPSGGSCVVGLCLGGMRFSLVRASFVHLYGFPHPRILLSEHSWHVQFRFFWWVGCWAGWYMCADVFNRSTTLAMLYCWSRHFAVVLAIGFCLVDR